MKPPLPNPAMHFTSFNLPQGERGNDVEVRLKVVKLVWFDFAHHESKLVFRKSKLDIPPHPSLSPQGERVHSERILFLSLLLFVSF